MIVLADAYVFLRDHLLVLGVATLVLALFPKLLSLVLERWRMYQAFKNIPTDYYVDYHFLLGHAPAMLKDMGKALDWIDKMTKTNKSQVYKIKYGPTLYQLTCVHPDAVRTVLRNDRGLLTANGPRWARSRRLLTPAFHYDILRPYMKVYADCVRELVGLWASRPEGTSFDVFPFISLLTLDIMLRCTCSFRSNCQVTKSHTHYIEAVYQLSELANRRILTFHHYFDLLYYLSPNYWKFKKYCDIVHEFSMNIIKNRRAELQKLGAEPPRRKYMDFIDILLEAKDDEGGGMSDLEIRAEVDTFMFEGHDTTASGITWTLYNLALYPEHQDICRKEVDDILGHKDTMETEDLKLLVHLKCCIKESMRLFPPVPATGRVLAQPTEIGGHLMPKGTPVVPNMYCVHRHPEFWENPDDFDPLRFTTERSKGRHSHAYVPFSAGPRNCIGQEFALNEERVVLAYILRNFELTLDETVPVVKDFLIILRPKNGLYLKLKHRTF